jgi:hypothetical protein
MAEFDREKLKAAFVVGKIPLSDDDIRRLDGLCERSHSNIELGGPHASKT